jgi:hypothetical protein
MPSTQTAKPTPSFETVWAALQELTASQKETDQLIKELRESQKDTDRIIKEVGKKQEETALQIEKTDLQMKKTDLQMKETDRRLGKLGNRFGEMVEHMVAPNLREKFKELGLIFPKANLDSDVSDYEHNIFLEIDVLLENGDKALLVEVKTKLLTEHIKEHIKRLDKRRKYADLHGDKRAFLGAVAGMVITANVKDYALKQGLFVIEPSGETFTITSPKKKPKEW